MSQDHSARLDDTERELFDRLSPFMPYLKEPGASPGARYAPTAQLVDLLLWNVVIAFLVNIGASRAYDWVKQLFERKEAPSISADDLRKIARGILTELHSDRAWIARLDRGRHGVEDVIAEVLEAHGLTAADAKRLSPELTKYLWKLLVEESAAPGPPGHDG